MPVTIRDVAQKAGVGLGTASRVLNNSPLVSSATRQRVLDVIAEINFVPSANARRLSLGKTLTVAAIIPFFTRPAFIERLRGIEATLSESAYDLVIYNVETPQKRDDYILNVPRRERADGVLIISLSPHDRDVAGLAQTAVPVVLVDAHHPPRPARRRGPDVSGAAPAGGAAAGYPRPGRWRPGRARHRQ